MRLPQNPSSPFPKSPGPATEPIGDRSPSTGHRPAASNSAGWTFAGPGYYVWDDDRGAAAEWAHDLEGLWHPGAGRER